MAQATWASGSSPLELVRASATLTESAFARKFGETPLLAVGVPAGQNAVIAGLELAVSARQPTAEALGRLAFRTTLSDDLAHAPSSTRTVDIPSLRAQLTMSPHYIIRLRKRAEGEAAYADRVSVGRAVSADLVLRHPSVSKSHAYFRLEGHTWQLSDAGSKNGSQLNGSPLVAREPQTLRPGDRIRFGLIDIIFFDATTLWRTLRPSG